MALLLVLVRPAAAAALHCGCCTTNPIGIRLTPSPLPKDLSLSGQYQMVGDEVSTGPRWWLMLLLRLLQLPLLLRLYLLSS